MVLMPGDYNLYDNSNRNLKILKCIVILNGGWDRLFASTTGAGLRTFVRSPNGRTRDRVFVWVVTCRERLNQLTDQKRSSVVVHSGH